MFKNEFRDEDMPTMPVEKTKFLEDMDEREINKALEMPAGIKIQIILIFCIIVP